MVGGAWAGGGQAIDGGWCVLVGRKWATDTWQAVGAGWWVRVEGGGRWMLGRWRAVGAGWRVMLGRRRAMDAWRAVGEGWVAGRGRR